MDGGGDGVEEALIGVRREVDDDLRGGGDRSGDFDVEHHFAVGAVGIAGAVCASIDGDGDDLRRGEIERVEIVAQVVELKAPAEFDEADALAGSVSGGDSRRFARLGWDRGKSVAA